MNLRLSDYIAVGIITGFGTLLAFLLLGSASMMCLVIPAHGFDVVSAAWHPSRTVLLIAATVTVLGSLAAGILIARETLVVKRRRLRQSIGCCPNCG